VGLLILTSATSASAEGTPHPGDVLAGQAAGDAYLIQNLGTTSQDFCADISGILTQARSLAAHWAAQFSGLAASDVQAEGACAGASNAWASAFQQLAQAWGNGWQNNQACTWALAQISEEARIASVEWKVAFDGFAGLSSTAGAGSAVSASNTWAYTFFVIFASFESTFGGATGSACLDGAEWAAVYLAAYSNTSTASQAWASHCLAYDSYSYSEKASGADNWANTMLKAANALDSSSTVLAANCQTSATEAAQVSSAFAYATSNFTLKLASVAEAWTLTFQNCAHNQICLGAAAGASNTWASMTFVQAFAQASQKWTTSLASDASVVDAAAAVWASCLSEVAKGARQQTEFWSPLFYCPVSLSTDTRTPFAASASNTWAYFFQTFGSSLEIASTAWMSGLVEASATWSAAFKEVAVQMEPAMVAWSHAFAESSTDLALSEAASASNAWVHALSMLSYHAAQMAEGTTGDQTSQTYSDASHEWAQAFAAIAKTANTTSIQWAQDFSMAPAVLSAPAGVQILSATDSWAYLFTQVSERATTVGLTWACTGCGTSWVAVIDFLLAAASNEYSAANQWSAVLGLAQVPDSWLHNVYPASWLHTISEITADKQQFT